MKPLLIATIICIGYLVIQDIEQSREVQEFINQIKNERKINR